MPTNVSPDHYVFFANDGVSGKEVWVTDGTEAGTFMLRDIGPGSQGLGDNGRLMPLPDGRVMFLGNDGAGDKLWATDGTPEGTVILRDAPAGFINDYFAMADGRLLFQMFDASDAELWITDGTSGGTMLLKDINPTPMNGSSMPSGFTALDDGRVIFSADDGTHGREVWVTDGTADGTVLVKDINTGAGGWNGNGAGSDAAFFTRLGDGRLIFRAEDGAHGNEIWVTDGTEAGTQLLKDIAPGIGNSYMTQPAALPDGRVIFSADMGGSVGRELWVTDGTMAGTVLVKDIQPGSGSSSLGNFTALSDGRMVFSAQTAESGHELWVTDGTTAGTFMLKEINPGAAHSYPGSFTPLADGRLLFSAVSASSGYELWVTDGTASGTTMVADMVAGADNFYPQNFTALQDGRVSFMATDGSAGFELWITDGTAAGTYQVKDINQGAGGSLPSRLQAVTPPSNAAPTGGPDVDGTPTQGEVLTASLGTLADADGFDSAAVTYRWQRESSAGQFTDIAGATDLTYTLGQADVGSALRVVASYTDGQGKAETVASATTAVVANINDAPVGLPVLAGTAQQGQVLNADISGLSDADGLDPAAVTFQWQRNDGPDGAFVAVAGATAASYTLTQADVGHQLRLVASYTDGQATAETVTSAATAAVENVNDAPVGLPVLAGTAQQGEVLSADISGLSDADGLNLTAVTFQWQRSDGLDGAFVNVAGATAASYTLTQADVGHQLRLVASYTDEQGTAEAVTSAATAAVANVNDTPTGEVILTGTAQRGSVLTATSTLADADGLGTLTYQWQRDDGAGASVTIDGATGSSYTLSRDDIGHVVHVTVSYTDGGGTAEEVTSAASSTVAARTVPVEAPANGVSPTLSLTSTEVAARLADGDVLMPPDQAAVIALADGSVSFGTATDAAFLTRLYGGLLGREGEANGLSFWAHHTSGGLNRVEASTGFLASAEYQAGHGSLDNVQFVEDLYRDMLGRVGEADGVSAHLQALTAGVSRADILVNFAESLEAQGHWSATTSSGIFVPGEYAGLIRAAYATAFGREAEASGVVWHGQALAQGLTVADFGDAIASSMEFLSLHGNQSDHDLIAALYVNGLGREGSEQEIAFYEDRLANHTLDRGDLVLAFATSSEAQNHLQWML